MFCKLQLVEPSLQIGNRHFHQFGNASSAYLHIGGFLLESCAMAVGTNRLATETAQHYAVLYFVLVLFHHLEEGIDTHLLVDVLFAVARQSVPEHILLFLCKIKVRLEDWEIVLCCTADELFLPHAHLLATPTDHAPIIHTH